MLLRFLGKAAIVALSLLGVAYFLEGISVKHFGIALLVSIIFGVVNVTLKPILVVLTLPLTILTFGLFIFVVNGFFFWIVSLLIPGFAVDSFPTAILGALIVSIVSWIGNKMIS